MNILRQINLILGKKYSDSEVYKFLHPDWMMERIHGKPQPKWAKRLEKHIVKRAAKEYLRNN